MRAEIHGNQSGSIGRFQGVFATQHMRFSYPASS